MIINRKWAMPNKSTFTIKPIKELLVNEIKQGIVLDPFAYKGTLKQLFAANQNVHIIDNDLNMEYKTNYHLDAKDFLKLFDDNSIDFVIYDPPFSPRQVSESYKNVGKHVTQEDTRMSYWRLQKNEIARILKLNGKVICFGWNSGGVGKTRGFKLESILLVPHGGNRNDTICTVERKVKENIMFFDSTDKGANLWQ